MNKTLDLLHVLITKEEIRERQWQKEIIKAEKTEM